MSDIILTSLKFLNLLILDSAIWESKKLKNKPLNPVDWAINNLHIFLQKTINKINQSLNFNNLQKLKKALNNVGLIPMNIKILDLDEEKTEDVKKAEVYINPYKNDLDSGLDIRV